MFQEIYGYAIVVKLNAFILKVLQDCYVNEDKVV